MKKFISLCMALVLALALAVPAAADESIGGADGPTGIFVTAADTGDVSVMVNGETVAFPDGNPEITNGRTMVPMRAVLETLGAEVDYDHSTKTVTASMDGETVLTHVIGTDTIAAGDGESLTMDTASYVSAGSTLVPLRFFSEVLGYEVYWDAGARTAVVIDKEALIEQLNESFTVINDLQAKQTAAASGNLSMEMDFSGSAKITAAGLNLEYPFSMKMSGVYGQEAINLTVDMDLSILAPLLASVPMSIDGAAADAQEIQAELQKVTDLLKAISFEMIYSDGGVWMKAPALSDLLREEGAQVPEGEVWMALTSEDMGQLMDIYDLSLSSNGVTMGEVLYMMAEMADADAPANIYEDFTAAGALYALLVGDDAFTKDGDTYTWKLDQAMMDKLAGALGAESVEFPGSMEMTLKEDGSCTFSMEMTIEDGSDAVSMSMSGSSTATESSIQGSIQLQGMLDVTFQGQAKTAPSETAPVTAPPAGETVIDLAGTPMAQ